VNRLQSFRYPDGSLVRGMPLTRPCSDSTCDHPLRVIVPSQSTKIVRTIPSSWRVAA
jgi:hypothetical protein